jgi:alpha-1,3-rhamnosyltransferase
MTDLESTSLLKNANLKFHDKRLTELPQLTVAICCFQQSVFVVESLERARQLQALMDCELFFIDDGSTDDSFDVALTWQNNTQTPALLISKTNRGLVDSLNLALKLANAPFVFFIAADDLLCSNALPILIQSLKTRINLGFAMGNCMCFGDNINRRPAYGKAHANFLLCPSAKRPGYLPSQLPGSLLIQTTVFRTDFLRKLGGWDPSIRLDDLQLFFRLFSMQIEPDIDYIYDQELFVSEYRYHANNSHRRLLHQFGIYEEFIRKAINKTDQPSEYAYALATYTLQAFLTRNLEALKFFATFAHREQIQWLTLYEILKRINRKIIIMLGNLTEVVLHRSPVM